MKRNFGISYAEREFLRRRAERKRMVIDRIVNALASTILVFGVEFFLLSILLK